MQFRKELKRICPDILLREGADMSALTSFRVGGSAEVLAEPASVREMAACVQAARMSGASPLWMGRGTNLLVEDGTLHMAVVRLGEQLRGIDCHGECLELQCGATLAAVSAAALKHGLGGFAFAQGIPGSVGGGVFMNAGAYGGSVGDYVSWSDCITPEGKIVRIQAEEHNFSYRHSAFMDNGYIVASTCIRLQPEDPAMIEQTMLALRNRREQSQPLDRPSAGSTFKRPKEGYAAALIEAAGLKGTSIGGAMVSQKHAGFIVNMGGATFLDITALMRLVRQRVLESSGLLLEPEVRIIDREGKPWNF